MSVQSSAYHTKLMHPFVHSHQYSIFIFFSTKRVYLSDADINFENAIRQVRERERDTTPPPPVRVSKPELSLIMLGFYKASQLLSHLSTFASFLLWILVSIPLISKSFTSHIFRLLFCLFFFFYIYIWTSHITNLFFKNKRKSSNPFQGKKKKKRYPH